MTAPAYCTAGAILTRSGTTDTASAYAAALAASRIIDAACRRRFWADTTATARTYRASDPAMLDVDDIATTTGLIVKTDTAYTGEYDTTIDSTNIVVAPANGVVGPIEGHAYTTLRARNHAYFPIDCHYERVEVTAKWGWAAVPATIAEICLEIAARGVAGPDAIRSETIGGYQVSYQRPNTGGDAAFFIADPERRALNPYCRRIGTFA